MNARNQAARTPVSLVVLCAVVGLGLNACTTSMRSNGIGTAQPTAEASDGVGLGVRERVPGVDGQEARRSPSAGEPGEPLASLAADFESSLARPA